MKKAKQGGYVYILDGGYGFFKVGASSNVKKRIAYINTHNPHSSAIYTSEYFPDMYKAEEEIHKNLAEYRKYNEWFVFDDQLLYKIIQEYNMRRIDTLEKKSILSR